MADVNLHIIGEVEKLSLKEGDVVVLQLQTICPDGIIVTLKDDLTRLFPDNKVVVLDYKVSMKVVKPQE